MKYWLPIWLATILFGLYSFTPAPESNSGLTAVTSNSGAKLIGGLTGGDGDPGDPDVPGEPMP